jgi:PAS domain S-box-containing protein
MLGSAEQPEQLDPSIVKEAIDVAPDGVVITDADGRIRFVNRSGQELFGYRADELVGQPIEILVPLESRAEHDRHRDRYLDSPVRRPMGLGVDLSARRRDGHEFPAEISLSPVSDGSGSYVVAVVRDVTERRRIRNALTAAQSKLAISDDRERIARNLHDTVIQRLFATGLALESSLGRADLEERAEQAISSIDAAIRELRTAIFSLRRAPDAVGLADALRLSAEEARRIIEGHLRVDVATELDRIDRPDLREELLAVVREALSNLARHAHADEATLRVTLSDGDVVVEVGDNGVGFDPADPRSGQGLSSLAARAANRGGSCRVVSAMGQGTRLEWRVPIS